MQIQEWKNNRCKNNVSDCHHKTIYHEAMSFSKIYNTKKTRMCGEVAVAWELAQSQHRRQFYLFAVNNFSCQQMFFVVKVYSEGTRQETKDSALGYVNVKKRFIGLRLKCYSISLHSVRFNVKKYSILIWVCIEFDDN